MSPRPPAPAASSALDGEADGRTCWSCGQDAALTVARLYRDLSTGRVWLGRDRPSCPPCATDDAAALGTPTLHGPRAIAITVRPGPC